MHSGGVGRKGFESAVVDIAVAVGTSENLDVGSIVLYILSASFAASKASME